MMSDCGAVEDSFVVTLLKDEKTSAGRCKDELATAVYCGQAGAAFVAVRVTNPELKGCGGLRRNLPTGGCAKGIALKESTPADDEPKIVPSLMVTDGPEYFVYKASVKAMTPRAPKATRKCISADQGLLLSSK